MARSQATQRDCDLSVQKRLAAVGSATPYALVSQFKMRTVSMRSKPTQRCLSLAIRTSSCIRPPSELHGLDFELWLLKVTTRSQRPTASTSSFHGLPERQAKRGLHVDAMQSKTPSACWPPDPRPTRRIPLGCNRHIASGILSAGPRSSPARRAPHLNSKCVARGSSRGGKNLPRE